MNWRETAWSPVGIGLRRTATAPADPGYPSWRITANWLPPGEAMEMLTPRETPSATSIWIVPPSSVVFNDERRRAARAEPQKQRAFLHPNGARRITGLKVTAPGPAGTPDIARELQRMGIAKFRVGTEWLVELTLDSAAQKSRKDLRPALPLILYY